MIEEVVGRWNLEGADQSWSRLTRLVRIAAQKGATRACPYLDFDAYLGQEPN